MFAWNILKNSNKSEKLSIADAKQYRPSTFQLISSRNSAYSYLSQHACHAHLFSRSQWSMMKYDRHNLCSSGICSLFIFICKFVCVLAAAIIYGHQVQPGPLGAFVCQSRSLAKQIVDGRGEGHACYEPPSSLARWARLSISGTVAKVNGKSECESFFPSFLFPHIHIYIDIYYVFPIPFFFL